MKSRLDYYVILLLGMVSFIAMIRAIFPMHGWRFYLEVIAFLVLAGFFAIATILVFNRINVGYILSAIIAALILANLLIIYYRSTLTTNLFLGMIASMTLFVVSVVSVPGKEEECCQECCAPDQPKIEIYGKEEEPAKEEVIVEKVVEKKATKKEEKKTSQKPEALYVPGKIVSSKTASYYHIPMCDWAQKIKPINQVWFKNEQEAVKAGLKPHTCLKYAHSK